MEGIGTAENHDLNATVIAGGDYAVPDISITDPDINLDPSAEFKVTIAASGAASFDLDYGFYFDALEFDGIGTDSLTFTMPYDASDMGGRPNLTLDNLLSTLHIIPDAVGIGTIIITIDDQGNFGACTATGDPVNPPAPCVKTSVTTINLDVQAGTPPADGTQITLTPVGG
jgi:hypothetical protein